MEEREFIDNYRKIVEQGAENPHNYLWNDTPMDSDIEDVWSNISLELDVDDVWNKVLDKLDKDKRRNDIRLIIAWSSAAVIFLLIGLFVFENKNIINKLSIQILETKQSKTKTNDKTTTYVSDNSINSKTVNTNNKRGLKALYSNKTIDTKGDSELEEMKIVDTLNHKSFSDSEENVTYESSPDSIHRTNLAILDLKKVIRIKSSLPSDEALSEFSYSQNEIIAIHNSYSIKGRLAIGISNAIKNTWLINRETKESFNKKDLKTTKLQFHPDFGLNLKYKLTNKWSAEVSGFFSSNIGQSYDEYVYGDYTHKNIKLRYASFEGSVQYLNYRPKFMKNLSFNSIVGFYFSRLRSANQTIGGEQESVYSQYTNIDYGVIFGQEVEIHILNQISIAPGIRLKIGVPNIYRGYSEQPSSLHQTKNGSIDFRFSIYYRLFK